MDTSRYFERTLFYDRSPAADEYYARSSGSIFETDPRSSSIEVRVQSSIDASYYEQKKGHGATSQQNENEKTKICNFVQKNNVSIDLSRGIPDYPNDTASNMVCGAHADMHHADSMEPDSDDAWSLSSKASSTAVSTALDQHQGSSPPAYLGPPKLTVVELDPANIRNFVKRTRNDFRVFYLRQRHSHSRLQITKELFEQLLSACHVFPRFNEYLIGFGIKNSDSEVGPPPLKFRPLCESHSNNYHGFGASPNCQLRLIAENL
jgi:hypothetical protein